MKMTNNTILVTGGTSGIGRALAEAFHDLGNRVIVTGRRQELLDEIISQRPGISGLQLDLNDRVSLAAFTTQVRDRHTGINVLIANAGVSGAEDMTADDWDVSAAQSIVETNIMGVLRVTAAVLPVLRRQENAMIMATSSALAFVPRADFATYSATKAFLHSWLQSLRHQLRSVPVKVLEIAPPYVRTAITGAAQASDPRAMPVEDYVQEVMRLLEAGHHPLGEVLLERDQTRRWAERNGNYGTIFEMLNPS